MNSSIKAAMILISTALLMLAAYTVRADEYYTYIRTSAGCRFDTGKWREVLDAVIADDYDAYVAIMSQPFESGCIDGRLIGRPPETLKTVRPMEKVWTDDGQCLQVYLMEDVTGNEIVTWTACKGEGA